MATQDERDLNGQIDALLGEVKQEIDISRKRRIFCNRNLKMESIEVIGFDMDYTLALYKQERLEQLSIELTLKKLIADRGYPAEILDLTYDSKLAIRGIVVDRDYGNVFKMDKHGYVGRVFHGLTPMSKDERNELYRKGEKIRLSSSRYVWIDTLFGLPDAVMYMTLVDYFDRHRTEVDYKKLFIDIRESIDEAHRDDTLKAAIQADMDGFIVMDPHLAETLHKLRSSGKKLFLLTNSYWPYTNAVMHYLLDGQRKAYPSWRNYFDWVIVGGRKPAFFAERNPFLEVYTDSTKVSEEAARELVRDRVYQGGNIVDLEDMTGVRGDKILYVGDHIYGDAIRLKKDHHWRTVLVLQELQNESATSERLEEQIRDLEILDRRRRNLQSEIDYQALMLKQIQRIIEDSHEQMRPRLIEARKQARETLDSMRSRAKMMLEEVLSLEGSIDRAYNPYWGSMFREANENSRFGQQVEVYADLYTSRASNFLSYSPLRYFHAPRKAMPHEQ